MFPPFQNKTCVFLLIVKRKKTKEMNMAFDMGASIHSMIRPWKNME